VPRLGRGGKLIPKRTTVIATEHLQENERVRGFSCLLLMINCVWPANALGHSYADHCQVSNEAFRLALAIHGGRDLQRLTTRDTRHLRMLKSLSAAECSRKNPRSYGDLAAYADYAFSPIEYYKFTDLDTPSEFYSAPEIPFDVIRAMGSVIQNAYVAHHNQDHFGDRAAFAQWFWHRMAVAEASQRNLAAALMMNAFAAHFAQDYLAPGHVATLRRNLPDAGALRIHNRVNSEGRIFVVDSLPALIRIMAMPGFKVSFLPSECVGSVDLCVGAIAGLGLRVVGDGHLKARSLQRFVMILLETRSLLDIFESFDAEKPVNSFGNREPSQPAPIQDSGRRPISFGHYSSSIEKRWAFPIVAFSSTVQRSQAPGFSGALFGLEAQGYWSTGSFGIPVGGFALAYMQLRDSGGVHHGYSPRIMFPVSRLDSQLSVRFLLVAGDQGLVRVPDKPGRFVHALYMPVGVMWEMGFGFLHFRASLDMPIDPHRIWKGARPPIYGLGGSIILSPFPKP
jgi:hypothetical protein